MNVELLVLFHLVGIPDAGLSGNRCPVSLSPRACLKTADLWRQGYIDHLLDVSGSLRIEDSTIERCLCALYFSSSECGRCRRDGIVVQLGILNRV